MDTPLKDRQYNLTMGHDELVTINQALFHEEQDFEQMLGQPQLDQSTKQKIREHVEMCQQLQQRLEQLVEQYDEE